MIRRFLDLGRLLAPAAVVLCAVLAGGCSSTSQIEELRFQESQVRDALARSVDQLEKERAALRSARAENVRLVRELEQIKASAADLSAEVESLTKKNETTSSQLESTIAELAKLKGTHARLSKMAQESLGELSELRQQNESLSGEKRRLEEQAIAREEQVTALVREVDDLRAELEKTRKAVRVIQENGERRGKDPELVKLETEKKQLEEQSTAQREQIVSLSKEVVALRGELSKLRSPAHAETGVSPATVLEDVEDLVTDRYSKALNGEIAWDAFDIAVVSAAGGLLVLALGALLFWLRHLRARHAVKRLQIQVDELEAALAEQEERAARESAEAAELAAKAAAAAPPGGSFRSRSFSTRRREQDDADRIAPGDFTPIMRSQSSRRAGAPSGEAAVTQVVESAGKAQPAQRKTQRKVIGAWRQDDPVAAAAAGPVAAAAPAGERAPEPVAPTATSAAPGLAASHGPGGAAAAVDDGALDEDAGATQIISDIDIDLLSESGALEPAALQVEQSRKRGEGSASPSVPGAAAPPPAAAQGTSEEQELLNELKSIINKKFDGALGEGGEK